MNPRSLNYYPSVLIFDASYVVVPSWMFSSMAVLTPPPPTWVCLVIENFYIYVFFFYIYIFLYGYLLHSVVYNTVVCINTIIYFSMGEKIQRQAWKNAIPAYWSMFFEQNVTFFFALLTCKPEGWNLWPLASSLMLVFFPVVVMKLLNCWKLIVCLIAWACAV